jgi:Flp pilus assembly protein TadG
MSQPFSNSPKSPLRVEDAPEIARRRLRCVRPASHETGGTLVEAGVTMTLLLMCIFGIMDCSRAVYVNHYMRYAADEAARYAMVRGSTWNGASCATVQTESCTATAANVTSFVSSITPIGINAGNTLAVTTTWSGNNPAGSSCSTNGVVNGPGCVVTVRVSYNFSFVLPFLPANAVSMGSTSSVAISQ